MTILSEKEIILNHALHKEDNLTIALKIGDAYEELRGRVIIDFLEAVEKNLPIRLGNSWKIITERNAQQIAAKYTAFITAVYQSHPAGFWIALVADEEGYPKRLYWQIGCDDRSAIDPAFLESLKDRVDREYGPGTATPHSVWYRYVDKAYSGWGSDDTLVRLYRKGDMVSYVTGHLEKLAQLLEKAFSIANPQATVGG